jgi:hypothetical protein
LGVYQLKGFEMTELAPITYRDFKIEMSALQDGVYRLRVVEAPGLDPMPPSKAEEVSFSPTDHQKSIARLEARRMNTDQLLAFGEALGKMLLPGRALTMFKDSLQALNKGQGLRLRLFIEPLALSVLPWEYALVRRVPGEITPNDFLALQPKISITRYETLGPALDPLAVEEKYRVVAALANPITGDPSLPDLPIGEDQKAIQGAVDALNSQGEFIELQLINPATQERLEEVASGADIFHFAGHGVYEIAGTNPDGTQIMQGKILLEDKEGNPVRYENHKIANLLADRPGQQGVRLVVLGACNTATRSQSGAWTDVASVLVREAIPAVVGMQFKVGANQAGRFIRYLYLQVLSGYPIDQAVSEARRFLYRHPYEKDSSDPAGDWSFYRDWGTPVLYLRDPTGVLFPEPELAMEAGKVNARMKARSVSGKLVNVTVEGDLDFEVIAKLELTSIEEGGLAENVTVDGEVRESIDAEMNVDTIRNRGVARNVVIRNLGGRRRRRRDE